MTQIVSRENGFSSLPVDELGRVVHHKIMTSLCDQNSFIPVEVVVSKIKLIAERTQYLFPIPGGGRNESKVDIFSDANLEFMWRWELISLDYLPNNAKASVKKARAGRRKLKNHQKAVTKLVQAINDIISSIQGNATQAKRQRLTVKVSTEEERVLKYERDEEKMRLLNDAKKQKELDKKLKEAETKRLEEEIDQEKLRLEEAKKAEKAKMQELREQKKKVAMEEKEKKKKEAIEEKVNKKLKQKSRMLSFFKSSSNTKETETEEKPINDAPADHGNKESFDSTKLWASIGSSQTNDKPIFSNLSSRAKQSKRRYINTVNVRVFVPTVSSNPFAQEVYDEERLLPIRNRYKYLSFREDFRPAYHGTWSKPRSNTVSGRTPLSRDFKFLNYDVDSEAEWEEGDDEQGEDCSENGNDDEEMLDDEEGDTTKYNYQDGWLAEDGDLVLEDDDEETQEIRKKKNLANVDVDMTTVKGPRMTAACVIAPLMGGIPQIDIVPNHIEGLTANTATDLIGFHQCEDLLQLPISLDPFAVNNKSSNKKNESAGKKASQKMTREQMIIFARFVHNSTFKSKDMVVEALRDLHKDITSSRAQATRKLDLIATKRRLKNGGGVIWEVKNDVLRSLGLHNLVKEPTPEVQASPLKKKEPRKEPADKGSKAKTNVKKNIKTSNGSDSKSPASKSTSKEVPKQSKAANSTAVTKAGAPALVSPKTTSPSRKRKSPAPVSKATVNLLKSFLKKKKTTR